MLEQSDHGWRQDDAVRAVSQDDYFVAEPSKQFAERVETSRYVEDNEDSSLIARIRVDPPDPGALDELVGRYWSKLYGRCLLLTVNPDRARDLAQDAWCRVLRARRSLKPDGNFPAYLTAIATNLWRDSQRHARRAGPMAEHRLASLNAPPAGEDEDGVALAEALPDLSATHSTETSRLKMDIDEALDRLTPLLRDVLIARFIDGESCAEIGRRYGRTEQSISGWVRQAIREMKLRLEDRTGTDDGTAET